MKHEPPCSGGWRRVRGLRRQRWRGLPGSPGLVSTLYLSSVLPLCGNGLRGFRFSKGLDFRLAWSLAEERRLRASCWMIRRNPIALTEKGFISSLRAFRCPEYTGRLVVQRYSKDQPVTLVRWQSRRGNEFLCFYF